MALNYYASSPTVVLPPQQPPDYFSAHARQTSPIRRHPTPPSLNYQAAVNTSAAGRKRSIQDVDPEDRPADCPNAAPPKPKPEPIYGPGMTLIYPDDRTGFHIGAESQTGTWAEEKAEKEQREIASRPVAVSRKSARTRSSRVDSLTEPDQQASVVIDEQGHTINQLITELGVGWANMMADPTASTRAYTRVIENHFALTNATIMLESERLSAYLVRATDIHGLAKYWLFHDSLSWCQLIGNDLQSAVSNLTVRPVPAVLGDRINAQRNTPPGQPSTLEVEMSTASADISSIVPQDDAMQM
ncbi:hypothetical protein EJ05DRAFT_213294 [Pseudovirgaria hyperparasitica]|uniref:Uncharacterized protein n=1 Tax=Pseudovirgaria hyperparasitica TaxID=470096 RepID=A0A6A6VVW2_9PEZI|nr:uncharacterized protein EJ05DRAFT_213294 [Pseudovirgaria hyperparasitica]KAF2753387.1 hypothetical protein EJ05DRAFT_213294 [Pseudovirgaria hyperparasitica]